MPPILEPLAQTVLNFWFGTPGDGGQIAADKSEQWFSKNPTFDIKVKNQFGDYLDAAFMGGFDRWTLHDEGLVALIVLLDQFPRNIFREQPRSFAFDKKALATTMLALEGTRYLRMPTAHAYFALMPTMHSESLAVQEQGIAAFSLLLQQTSESNRNMITSALRFAEAHLQIIERFGRFPHRNSILGRESTAEELSFLTEENSRF